MNPIVQIAILLLLIYLTIKLINKVMGPQFLLIILELGLAGILLCILAFLIIGFLVISLTEIYR